MTEIRTTKIDGVEFVPYKDYLRLKEENKDLNKQIEQFKKGVKAGTNIIERLEEENQKLKEEKQELEYLGDINEELKEENKKLKEKIKELEATNKKRTADNWTTFK